MPPPYVRTSAIRPLRRLVSATLPATCALLVALAAAPASATWRTVRDVSRGTAEVLEKGELTFGVFAPIAYGVTDSLTIQSSPIFDLLLIPNLTLRYRFLRSDTLVLAATANYKQAFLGDRQPGEFDIGVMGSLYTGRRYALTGGLLIAQRFFPAPGRAFEGGVAIYGAVHALVNSKNLLLATAYLRTTASAGAQRPLLTVAWIRQLRMIFNMHIVLGLSYGTFPLRGSSVTDVSPITDVRVWPVLDAWWRY